MRLSLLANAIIAASLSMFPGAGPLAASTAEPGFAIQWEISNRFSPFEVLADPEATFEVYRLQDKDGGWRGWHRRKWREMGPAFASPYGDALAFGAPLPWQEKTQRHSDTVLRFVRHEFDPATTIGVRLWLETDAPCTWEMGAQRIPAPSCSTPISTRMPLSGAAVSVHFHDPGTDTDRTVTRALIPGHMVIVALGDSYGSGEGNPDLPARWRPGMRPEPGDVRWLTGNRHILRDAGWLSERCHRSFFSHQSLTALALASQDPHRFVSFLHYACTGAEIFDGVLGAQKTPGDARGFNQLSQLNAARLDLCRSAPARASYEALDPGLRLGTDLSAFHRNNQVRLVPRGDFDGRLKRSAAEGQEPPRDGILTCPGGDLRRPDLLLLSVGGNDIGFAELISYYVAPVRFSTRTGTKLILPDICPDPAYRTAASTAPLADEYCRRMDAKDDYHVGELIGHADSPGGMRARYGFLFDVLRRYLHVASDQIVMAQYPDPLRRSEAEADSCWAVARKADVVGGPEGYDPQSPWNGLKSADPTGFLRDDPFTLRHDEALNLLRQVDDFRHQLTITARLEGIVLACAGRDAMVGHGWWQGRDLVLPGQTGGVLDWPPARWQPYRFEEDGRAIRTGNDSALTQADGGISITGTAHPNLTGHSLISDAVLSWLAGLPAHRQSIAAAYSALSTVRSGNGPF